MKKAKDLNIFAKRLGELIKEHKLVHEDIAQAIDVTRQGVGKWVNGESVPDVLTVAKLAKFLGVSVDYLAGASEIKTTNAELKGVCEYTGLSENSINLLNLLNQVKQLGIEEFQPSLIDILDRYLIKMDKEQQFLLFSLRDAINVDVREDDEDTQMRVFESLFKLNSSQYCISGNTYRNLLLQEYKEKLIALTNSVFQSMINEDAECNSTELGKLSQNCQNILNSSELINTLLKEASDNGNNNPKEE